MFSRYFIDRPVLANVIAFVTLIVGGICLYYLPVSQYPNITPPTIVVTAAYPGANAQTVVKNVGLPIEEQVDGIEGVVYMQSTSSSAGAYNLTVAFETGTNSDLALTLVQNRVSSALSLLPGPVQSLGVKTQKASTSILAFVSLTSENPRHDNLYLSNFASINLLTAFDRLPGVGKTGLFGGANYSMRIWLDPELMRARRLIPGDVVKAIVAQGSPVTAGQIGSPPSSAQQMFQYTVDVSGQLNAVEQYENIIVKTTPGEVGRVVRLIDVARIEMGADSYIQSFTLNGRPAAGIAIYQRPGTNALDAMKQLRETVERLSRSFPAGMTYQVPFDTTKFVDAAIQDVYMTLIEAALLVLLVIVFFLQDWRASLVPATTVPVTIIGAFAAMAALGFSANLTTLFAIVLAIGIVVDDAIVVVEGAARHVEEGRSGREAAALAMDDLFAPILAITLVLMAVFVPAALLPGISGRMYGQFALVIAATALISAINAVTLKPAQCARWLRPPPPTRRSNIFYRVFNAGFGFLERGYIRFVAATVRHYGIMAFLALGLSAAAIYGFTRIPTAFLPLEDQGYFLVGVELPAGATLGRTAVVLEEVGDRLKSVPGVSDIVVIGGISLRNAGAALSNAGIVYVNLEDWDSRGSSEGVISILRAATAKIGSLPDAEVQVFPPTPIPGVGSTSGFSVELELREGRFDVGDLDRMAAELAEALRQQPEIGQAYSPSSGFFPQLKVDIDRLEAKSLGVSFNDLFDTMGIYIGSSKPLQFVRLGQLYYVTVQAEARFRATPEDIERLPVRNAKGEMVPVGAVAKVSAQTGPSVLTLYNRRLAVGVVGRSAAKASSGEVLAAIDRVATAVLPPQFDYEFSGLSYQERVAGNLEVIVFVLAVVLIYFILAALYGSWLAPLSVVLSVPFALAGTSCLLLAMGLDNNLYTQIGSVLLIALVSKNAILIVEFARVLRQRDRIDIVDAALEAAKRRFRPIVMTSLTFILGVLPLVFAGGAAANAQKSIGMAVVSGMLAATVLTVIFVPSYFVLFQRLEERFIARNSIAAPGTRPHA